MTLNITFLFGTEYGEDIILSGRYNNKTVFLRITNIEHYILIGKIPGMTDQEFYNFLNTELVEKYPYKHYQLEKVMMCDSTMSTLNQPYTFYKIFANKSDLEKLCKLTPYTRKTEEPNFGYITYKHDNRLLPNDPKQQSCKYQISQFYTAYLNQYYNYKNNHSDQIKGIDNLLLKQMYYPFRATKQDLSSIQAKYNLNFFDTLSIPSTTQSITNPEKYSCDIIYYCPINQIIQAQQSTLMQDLNQYWSIMYDIENYVYIQQHHIDQNGNQIPPTLQLLDSARQQFSNDPYFIRFTHQFEKTSCEGFYDANQIICISLIEQNFNNQIGEKIALVRSNGDPQYESSLLEKINFDYVENKQSTNNYCNHVYPFSNEELLLHHLIHLLSSNKYHIIQHFNGWNFDERVIMSRMCLYPSQRYNGYSLLFDYFQAMKTIRSNPNDLLIFNGSYKIPNTQERHDLCQLRDPLKFSLDVYQINLHDSVDSQKNDSNSLNGLLELYDLGLKGDVSYQQLNDWFQHKDYLSLIKGFWYCQRDSLQQCVLQAHLKIILNYVQFSNLCRIGLQSSVQKAVGTKIVSTLTQFYISHNLAFLDITLPYHIGNTLQDGSSLTNVGGEVICFKPGFDKYISAVDAASMYPAQVEANNISNNCMLYPQELDYIIQHQLSFNIQSIQVDLLMDMYSPHTQSWTKLQSVESILQYQTNTKTFSKLFYIREDTDTQQTFPRYRINITLSTGTTLSYEQFFFERKNMSPVYNYVFYLQGHDQNNIPYSPRSDFLTSFRFLRKNVKKQMKTTKDSVEAEFLNGKQQAIKICMNGSYGASDIDCYCLYELIGPSAITYQSRCIIHNCRDNILHHRFYTNSTIRESITPTIQIYNNFILQTILPEDQPLLLITIPQTDADILVFPKLEMKYQDTDSNYFIMPILDSIRVQPQFQSQYFYIKTQIFGLFNDVFSSFINSSMNKFPLEFDFEGAFYRAWHIQKKMYLGQKVPQYTCSLENGHLKPLTEIHDHIDLSSFDPNVNIYKFLSKHHIKVTGLKLIKRDAILLLKTYYIKLIQELLNSNNNQNNNILEFVSQELINLNQIFQTIPVSQFVIHKKINQKDLEKRFLQDYNADHQDQPLGLGTVMYYCVVQPQNQLPNQFISTAFKVEDYTVVIPQENLNKIYTNLFKTYYIYNIASNLLSTVLIQEDDETLTSQKNNQQKQKIIDQQTKQLLQQTGIIQQFRHNQPQYNQANIQILIQRFRYALENNLQEFIHPEDNCFYRIQRLYPHILRYYQHLPPNDPQSIELNHLIQQYQQQYDDQ